MVNVLILFVFIYLSKILLVIIVGCELELTAMLHIIVP